MEEMQSTTINHNTTKYECDYCGGFEVENKDDNVVVQGETIPVIQTVIGLYLSHNPVLNLPEVKVKVCPWCWKKSLDNSIKPSKIVTKLLWVLTALCVVDLALKLFIYFYN